MNRPPLTAKTKSSGVSRAPRGVRRGPLQRVERAVDLDRGQPLGGVLQLAALRQARRVEVAAPAGVAPAGDADPDGHGRAPTSSGGSVRLIPSSSSRTRDGRRAGAPTQVPSRGHPCQTGPMSTFEAVHEPLVARDVLLGRTTHVRRLVPNKTRRMIGAWCFLDHYGPDDIKATGGMWVPPHPHTGLQTVTWLFEGLGLHTDSLGSRQLIRPGQLNVMTAGHGICHAEVSPEDAPTHLHGVQLWVCLPDAVRDTAPAGLHPPRRAADVRRGRRDGPGADRLAGAARRRPRRRTPRSSGPSSPSPPGAAAPCRSTRTSSTASWWPRARAGSTASRSSATR